MSTPTTSPAADLAELVLWVTSRRPATLGRSRLICVDGPTGSGKTVLARALAAASRSVALAHVDDMLDGWAGLPRLGRTVRSDVLVPLVEGRPGRYRRYDWTAARFAGECEVAPADLVVLDGVGSADSSYDAWITTLVWMDAPASLRLERGVTRDGEALRPQLLEWSRQEARLFARERTRERADVLVEGSGTAEQRVLLA